MFARNVKSSNSGSHEKEIKFKVNVDLFLTHVRGEAGDFVGALFYLFYKPQKCEVYHILSLFQSLYQSCLVLYIISHPN